MDYLKALLLPRDNLVSEFDQEVFLPIAEDQPIISRPLPSIGFSILVDVR